MLQFFLQRLPSSILRIHLSWAQLKYQKTYTLAAVVGIAFTTILLFMQIECRSGLIESFAKLPASFKGDIFLVEARSTNLNSGGYLITSRTLYKTLAIEAVESVTPIYFDNLFWRTVDKQNPILNTTRVIGFSLEKHPGSSGFKGIRKANEKDRLII
jgi:putative ABC transport system permease protein